MNDRQYIDYAKTLLGHNYGNDTIIYELKEFGTPESMMASVITVAKVEYFEERGKHYIKSNKLFFYLWLTLSTSIFILVLFVLPHMQWAVGHNLLFSFLGSALFCLFAYLAFIYYKKWDKKFAYSIGKPKFLQPVIIIIWIPAIILYYVFSACFSYVQDNILKETQIEATGHIVSGSSLVVRKLIGGEEVSLSRVVVSFQTKDGKDLIVTKDIDAYQMKSLYKGEEIHLVYSSVNPQNISLLTDDDNIREFKNTQERDLIAPDLLHLVTVSPDKMLNELNKISYGWVYNPNSKSWLNEKRQCAISIKAYELDLLGKSDFNDTYPIYLVANGFVKTNKADPDDVFKTGNKVFENKQFIFNVAAKVTNEGQDGFSIISVIHK